MTSDRVHDDERQALAEVLHAAADAIRGAHSRGDDQAEAWDTRRARATAMPYVTSMNRNMATAMNTPAATSENAAETLCEHAAQAAGFAALLKDERAAAVRHSELHGYPLPPAAGW